VFEADASPVAPARDRPSETIRSPKTAELVARRLRRMVVDGLLKDGDFLPHEAELMTHFGVSRPTLREAVRVLESERLVEVRRGSRTGARVRVPGSEIIARPAGLILELSGATLADVLIAREAFEPLAAKLLAENGTDEAHTEMRRLVDGIPLAQQLGDLATATASLHRRLVELSGNVTLSLLAGMLYEITARHTEATFVEGSNVLPKVQFTRLLRSYYRLVELIEARDGEAAEAHWRRHMENAGVALLKGYERTKVRDMLH
jgi:GntR family transcriptional regulator, transcriptional repressor for pyruvate dehydrogenase complex